MLGHEKDSLLKKLMAVENEEREASVELNKLRDMCRKLKHVRTKKNIIQSLHIKNSL